MNALATKPHNSALAEHYFKPGQSGNPGGQPKRIAELRRLSLENFPAAVERLKKLINSDDDELAFRAVQFAYLYVLGKPAEAQQLAHLESMRARTQELVIPQPQLETPLENPLPLQSESAPSRETEAMPPEVPVTPLSEPVEAKAPPVAPSDGEVKDVSRVPTGLPEAKPQGMRCLFRGKEGRCETVAEEGLQWCSLHKARLFEQIKI